MTASRLLQLVLRSHGPQSRNALHPTAFFARTADHRALSLPGTRTTTQLYQSGGFILVWLLLASWGIQLASAQDEPVPAVEPVAETIGDVLIPSANQLTLTAWRVTLPAGAALRTVVLPGPVLIAVETGELIVGGPRRQWEGGTSRLRAGEVATLDSGARVRPRAEQTTPVTFLFVSLIPLAPSHDGTQVVSTALIPSMEEAR